MTPLTTTVVTETITMNVDRCIRCGVYYALEAEFEERRRKDGREFYCVNGHSMTYGKSEAAKLREQIANERRAVNDAYDRLNQEKARHAATKGQLTKLTNRIHEGVCPHCNRTFKQLERHMRAKHKTAADAAALAKEMQA